VNANQNKGVTQFIAMAHRMPNRKFLGIIPYYGELSLPPAPSNIEWIPFDDDIRNVLKRTRILVMPSYYESFGRIAVEAMYNGIPVLYSKPLATPKQPSGTTEGLEAWISPGGIPCNRENIDEWVSAITKLDDETVYTERSSQSREHIAKMNLFTEATRIAEMVEQFVRDHPVKIQSPQQQQIEAESQMPTQTATRIVQPTGRVGFSSGRLRIQR
jgi:glycosyltransferase involved in cell wall biosynthesis